MRIAVVGPTHPSKGGVAAPTTRTAHALAGAGHDVDLVSWSRLYPFTLYPGEQSVPAGEVEVEYERTSRPLRWDRPLSWWRTGRALHGPWVAYAAALTAMGGPDDGLGSGTLQPGSVRCPS